MSILLSFLSDSKGEESIDLSNGDDEDDYLEGREPESDEEEVIEEIPNQASFHTGVRSSFQTAHSEIQLIPHKVQKKKNTKYCTNKSKNVPGGKK